MDKITQDIVTYLNDLQKNQLAGDLIPIPNSSEMVRLIRPISFSELRKWRQQFLNYIKMHPTNDTSKIRNMFVEYINNMMN
jgi:protein KTI12